MFQAPSSLPMSYTLAGKITGHKSGITMLSALASGRLLASAGETHRSSPADQPTVWFYHLKSTDFQSGIDDIKIWRVRDRRELSTPTGQELGHASAMSWFADQPDRAKLVFGTTQGFLAVWKENVRPRLTPCTMNLVMPFQGETFQEVTSKKLAGDISVCCLVTKDRAIAFATRTGFVQVLRLDEDDGLTHVFAVDMSSSLKFPQILSFAQNANLYVFGNLGGEMCVSIFVTRR